jgi:hypothetical protein
MSLELPNPTIHRQKNSNDSLTALAIDRLSLSALHNPIFDEARLCPPKGLNGYENPAMSRAFPKADDGTRTHDLLHGKQTL